MRAGKISDLVHAANVAGLETQNRETVRAHRAPDNSMTPADFVRHWVAAESSKNAAKLAMLTDLHSCFSYEECFEIEKLFYEKANNINPL